MINKDILIITLVLLFGVVIGYIFYGNNSSILTLGQPERWKADNIEKLSRISLDLKKLDTRFNELEIYGEYPVTPGVTGKVDIFAPF